MFYIDKYYLLLVLPTIILGLIAQIRVKTTYSKYSAINNSSSLTGAAIANMILERSGVMGVIVRPTSGELTDNYNPKEGTVNLSQGVYGSDSIAAIGIAAHECGHAIQHDRGYFPVKLRSALVPVVNISNTLSWIVIIVGLAMASDKIAMIGVIIMAAATLFYLVTLPVELNASRRAMKQIEEMGVATKDDLKGIKKVLTAAAMTYITALLTSAMSLLRVFLLVRGRSRD